MKGARWARRVARWLGTAAALAVLVLYVANLPFYAGGGLGPRMGWRMEHGRVLVQREAAPRRRSFWIDGNTEGLRFAPEWGVSSPGVWRVNIPLWVPLAGALAIAAWGWRGRRKRPGTCERCGYELGGLSRCPECGEAQAG